MVTKESKTDDKVDRHDSTEESNDDIEANKKHKITWVGTSLSKPLDKKKFEHDSDVNLTVKKAYCIKAEGRFKEANFTAIVPELVKKGGIDTMVLQTGSIEFTNLDVNKAMMDAKKDISEYKKEWYAKAEEDSKSLFAIAEDAIARDPKLNVVIVKRFLRFDRASKDISKIPQSGICRTPCAHLWHVTLLQMIF